MVREFIHLRVHTEYSLNNGLAHIKDFVEKAVVDGMRGMAITDFGNMFGIREFYDVVSRLNKRRTADGMEPFKPIIGCEMFVSKNGSKEHQDGREDMGGNHLVLLAKNLQGYKNLIKLVSFAWEDGFNVSPRTDQSDLERYHEGLIAMSGAIDITDMFVTEKQRESIQWYHRVFGDDYYLDLERNEVKDDSVIADRLTFKYQNAAGKLLQEIAKEYGIKIICTNDVRYVNQDQAEAFDRLYCLTTGRKLDDERRYFYPKQEWFKTQEEMNTIFSDIPEALTNTIEILDKVEFYSIDHQPVLPLFPFPAEYASDTQHQDLDKVESKYLENLTFGKARQIYGESLPSDVEDRLRFELEVICSKGFSRYFLILQDLVNNLSDHGAVVGPGRGSAAGSLVAYCLGITKIDPLKHDLLFERFVSLNRPMLPDIDLDFDEEGYEMVKPYLQEKYGYQSCANIVTFSHRAIKSTIKDIARLEGVPVPTSNALCKEIPTHLPNWAKMNMENLCKYVPAFKTASKSRKTSMQNLVKYVGELDGMVRGTGVHACGLVISQGPVSDWVPTCISDSPDREGEKMLCTQYDGLSVESSGLVKMDFLCLRVLTELKMACSLIMQKYGIVVNMHEIPIDDAKTFELYQQGHTVGVFQFESSGMQKYLRALYPTTFEDLVALNALYRPGPMNSIPSFIARKNGEEEISYDIPCMEKYLNETYGIMVYQEQLMLLSRLIADFTREESDLLRKALGKKKKDVIDVLKPKFFEGGRNNGHPLKALRKVWSDWEKSGCYAFNKSHSVSYTWIGYQTAYLKANFPEEYMATLMNCRKKDGYDYHHIKEECNRLGLQVKS